MTDTIAFPPQQRLAHIVKCLSEQLPQQFADLLNAERFIESKAALERLAIADSITIVSPEEADYLATLLLQRWANIAPVALAPAIAITGPSEVWLSRGSRELKFGIATLELDDDWQAEWTGTEPKDNSHWAYLTVAAPADNSAVVKKLCLRILGRAMGQRCILVAEHQVQVRRPELTLNEQRNRLLLKDQTGTPGANVAIDIAEHSYLTQENGLVELALPLESNTVIQIAGEVLRLPPS